MTCVEMKATLSFILFLSLWGLNLCLFRKHVYVNKRFSWEDAQTYCREHHGDLSTITFNEGKQILKNSEITDWLIWVGLYKCANSEWCWSDGENEPLFWFYGQPDYLNLEHCASIFKTVPLLANYYCGSSFTFFCMEIFEVVLVNEKKTWEEALDYCRMNYIDLVSLTSGNITRDVVTNKMTAQTANVWTGLRFLAGHWFWVSGDEYDAWSQNVTLQCPANNLRCAALDTQLDVLTPRDCEEKLNFFCFKRKTNV